MLHSSSPLLLLLVFLPTTTKGQTEGDPGYDYESYESYDENAVIGVDPSFDSLLANVTVIRLQTAILPCSIEYLGKYKVAWLDSNFNPITYEDRRIIDDSRFSVVRSSLKEWNIQIREIRREDEGQYRCTINTNPVKFKEIMLHVRVPATIIDKYSSGDKTVVENDQVTLVCNVTGVPMPHVTWHMHSNRVSSVRNKRGCKFRTTNGAGAFGSTLAIPNVTRHCHDIFECTASNGVPPDSSRQIKLSVQFAPQIHMPNNRILQVMGRETILDCNITAFPHAVNYWEKNGHRISSSMKHRIDAYKEGDQIVILSLKVIINDPSDFGEYKCVAANWLGRDEKIMQLFEATKTKIRHSVMSTSKLPVTDFLEKIKTFHEFRKVASTLPVNFLRLEKQTGDDLRKNGCTYGSSPTWTVNFLTIAASCWKQRWRFR